MHRRRTPTLRRALGRWDLTAIGVNQVIGGAIFLMPVAGRGADRRLESDRVRADGARLADRSRSASRRSAAASTGTGGPYLYTRAAFGRFAAFEVGWMQWFTRAASQASVMAGIAVALGYYWPAMTSGWPRAALLTASPPRSRVINVRGIRQSAWLVNALTIGKLVPLALFIVVGLLAVEHDRLTHAAADHVPADRSTAALLLIFVYGGFDVVPVPAGEAIDPRRARAVRAGHDDRVGDGRDDARADRRAGRAAGSGRRTRRRSPTRRRCSSAPAARCSSASGPSCR